MSLIVLEMTVRSYKIIRERKTPNPRSVNWRGFLASQKCLRFRKTSFFYIFVVVGSVGLVVCLADSRIDDDRSSDPTIKCVATTLVNTVLQERELT